MWHTGDVSSQRPNILFITADQWRGDCLSLLGHRVQTPNLDALAAEGTLFERHFANAVPCGPSRASLHTGMYLQNHRSGTNGTPLDHRFDNWALQLRSIGYTPSLFGYTDTALDPRFVDATDPRLRTYEGLLPGIEPIVEMGTFPDAWAAWLQEKGYAIPEPNWRLYTEKQDVPEFEAGGRFAAPLAIPKEHHDTTFMVDKVLEYVMPQSDPWCVHLSLLRPHPPWVAPFPYNELYDPRLLSGFNRAPSLEIEANQHPFLAAMLEKSHYRAPNDQKMARLRASYFGLMSEVDTQLGRLFNELKQGRQWDNTLVIFTSDHGEQLGHHHLLGKLGYFDDSYHVPLIVRLPASLEQDSRPNRVGAFTEHVDIMPTLLEAVGLTAPVQCDGKSLLGLLHDKASSANWRNEAHWEYDFRDVASGTDLEQALNLTLHQCSLNVVRGDRFKYVHFTSLPPLLFDLAEDPYEMRDVSGHPDYQAVMLEYTQKLLSWRMNHDEQTLTEYALTDDGVMHRRSPRY